MHHRLPAVLPDGSAGFRRTTVSLAHPDGFPVRIHDAHDVILLKITLYSRNTHRKDAGDLVGQQEVCRLPVQTSFPEQSGQTPLTMKLTESIPKPSGRSISGMRMSFRQKVLWQTSQ